MNNFQETSTSQILFSATSDSSVKPSIKYFPRNWLNSSRLEVLKKSVKLLIFQYIYPNLLPFIKNHFAATSKLLNFNINQVQLPFFDKYLIAGPRILMNVEIFKESLTSLLLLFLAYKFLPLAEGK